MCKAIVTVCTNEYPLVILYNIHSGLLLVESVPDIGLFSLWLRWAWLEGGYGGGYGIYPTQI